MDVVTPKHNQVFIPNEYFKENRGKLTSERVQRI